jgi:nucleoside-triphosphatase THEP1
MGSYDIFISHCGADCKRHFAVWLLRVLENVGLRCFFDDRSLELGDNAAKEMLEAMETAKYGIVILSAGFFGREWCMKELQTFVKRGRILPVFFGTFDEVQRARSAAIAGRTWQTFRHFVWTEDEYCSVAKASTRHTGLKLESLDGYWDTLLFKVRDEVLGLLGRDNGGLPILEVKLFVGQEDHLVKLKELLGVHASDGAKSTVVGIVGVKGMGGVGKSTIAKKLYDDAEVREHFAGTICWLEVGPKPSKDRIRDLQKQILKRFCDSDEDPGNPSNGRALIRQRLSGKKVLICLDDVWEDASTFTAVVNVDDLAPGSRILKTSRIRGAIEATGAVHEMDVLGPGVAWELFCWHAFGGKDPDSSLAEKAEQAAGVCAGLPLALELVGKQVRCAKDMKKCLEALLKLPKHAEAMTACRESIQFSFDRLLSEPLGLQDPLKLQDVFVMIAGVWPNTPRFRERQRAIENIGAAVFGEGPARDREETALAALKRLRHLSLIGFAKGKHGKLITVHDLIVDFAEGMRRLIEEGSTRLVRYPSESNRKVPEHTVISTGGQFSDWPRGVASLVFEPGVELSAVSSGMDRGISQCRLLSIDQPQPSGSRGFGNHWGIFDHTARLRCLRLHKCQQLEQLPGSIESMQSLRILEVSTRYLLQSLPEGIGQLTGLTTLDLNGCKALASLPEGIKQLTELTTLDLRECDKLQTLPEGIGQLTGLKTLSVSSCGGLESVPAGIGQLTRILSCV